MPCDGTLTNGPGPLFKRLQYINKDLFLLNIQIYIGVTTTEHSIENKISTKGCMHNFKFKFGLKLNLILSNIYEIIAIRK